MNVYNKMLIKVPRCFGREIGILQGELIGAYQVPYTVLFVGGCNGFHCTREFRYIHGVKCVRLVLL